MLLLSDAGHMRAVLEICHFYFTCIFINFLMRFGETSESLLTYLRS
jgi:hypothetical protein